MVMLSPRVHAVGVRFSEEEYEDIISFCSKNGMRSVSDLARKAILAFMEQAAQKKSAVSTDERDAHVKRLEKKVHRLSVAIEQLQVQLAISVAESNCGESSSE